MEQSPLFTFATRLTGLACPKCNSTSFHKHGFDLGIQRYRCKECGRSFKETINTPLHWIHNKPKMQRYISTMHNRQSIRDAAFEIGISKNTSFSWRHKLLSSLAAAGTETSSSPAGICEIRLPHSFKGRRDKPEKSMPDTKSILIADARGIPCLHLLKEKKPVAEVSALFADKLNAASEITSVKSNILSRAVRKTENPEIKHVSLRKSSIAKAVKTINELFSWMKRFNGVATRYLQQYWNWYRLETNTGSLERFSAECLGQRQLQTYRKFMLT